MYQSKLVYSALIVSNYLPWWLRQWSVCLQCGSPRFDPWVGKIPWRRKWQPTPVLLPGEPHGLRSLGGYSPWGRRVGHDWATSLQCPLKVRRICSDLVSCIPDVSNLWSFFPLTITFFFLLVLHLIYSVFWNFLKWILVYFLEIFFWCEHLKV